ncbi:hypothetical protein N475_23655 [Pseudoalteromonas luteoviolacea DSM 6061]|uniref:Uncharacterized protein n=1 Tax=Pseudoalteromonas luteoviolacea DSM 6061 TaxID=1365250 RepID=A0A166UZA1_9GAMM|nr:hypothetical protein N475_23655 [Pseudoalteromonas luteoviolacea DSM 6061]
MDWLFLIYPVARRKTVLNMVDIKWREKSARINLLRAVIAIWGEAINTQYPLSRDTSSTGCPTG